MDYITYFLIGSLVGLLLEITNRNQEKPQNITPLQRLIMIIAWPIIAVTFIYQFFKSLK